ncbi:MAG: tetraacyldisaccharide 4'-kinase [Pyramidobacter sp.]|jgi:tetraacyldisaccharide 4'-kinase
MNGLTKSYLSFTRGESKLSPWMVLVPFGWLGELVVRAGRFCYDHGLFISEEMPLPVISVGNITTGGTNKTPFVEYVARHFCRCGLRPGIISRGYGGKTSRPVVILGGNADRTVVSDEPLLLSGRLPDIPIAVSRDRCADIEALRKYNLDVVIADDAFQHRKMARDLDIVLVDAICPFGNGRMIPGGTLREAPDALSRAHVVVISKADQTTPEKLDALKKQIGRWVPCERIFCSRLGPAEWHRWDGRRFVPVGEIHGAKLAVFSGIGNPKSFYRTVKECGNELRSVFEFKDHHCYNSEELARVETGARTSGCEALCCTEKDIYNLPPGYVPEVPLYVPRISTRIDEERRFWKTVTELLRPHLIVASNGYGEDAMGVKLTSKLRGAFPSAVIGAFPLVGKGTPYEEEGVDIVPPLSASPTGGIIKYHFRDLLRELRAGLLGHVLDQLRCWKKIRIRCRTVLCVGDAYLLCNTVWGQGRKALLIATAKTQFISGHWRLESFLFRWGAKKVWTRDEATARELRKNGVNAVFEGNPIMDLLSDGETKKTLWGRGRRILVLPGSRNRAYKDLNLLLEALTLIAEKCQLSAVMVAAPSIDVDQLARSAIGWDFDGSFLSHGSLKLRLLRGDAAEAARGAELLLGLAGTANQVCAGMGIPVLSIREKGKFVQKKLLGDSELLVDAVPESLAEAALQLFNDPPKLVAMGEAGKKRLGQSGALDAVIGFAAQELGWKKKCDLYDRLKITLL